jgi:hypothetical protein
MMVVGLENIVERRWIVKKLVMICSVLLLQGLSSYGQTNVAPPTGLAVLQPGWQEQKGAYKLRTANVAVAHNALSPASETQSAELATFRRINRNSSLTPRAAKKNYDAMLHNVFPLRNDLIGATDIRDTVITIFPPGR